MAERFEDDEKICEVVRTFLLKTGVEDAQLYRKEVTKPGDGYLGVTSAIQVKTPTTTLEFFIKVAPKDKALRETLKTQLVFNKEINFYMKVLPCFDQFVRGKIGESLRLSPKCIVASNEEPNEMLVLENLKEQGFCLFDRQFLMDTDHVMTVFKGFAKLHAVSFALKDQEPKIFDSIRQYAVDDKFNMIYGYGISETVRSALRTLRSNGNGMINEIEMKKLDEFNDSLYDFLKLSADYEDAYKVVLHGDCWMNNMLFKYKENTKTPTEMRFIDFQITGIDLPVFDLSYLIYTSACTQENLDKLDWYLDYYYQNLTDFLLKFGSDPKRIYPRQKFDQHWKTFCRYGLMLALCVTKLILSEEDDSPNITDRDKGLFTFDLKRNDEYVERMSRVVKHFIKNNYI